MKVLLHGTPEKLVVNHPTKWIMRVFTQGGLGKLPGDAVTSDLAENQQRRLEVSRSMPMDRALDNMIRNGRRPEFAKHYLEAMLFGGETDATALELVREHAFKDLTGQVAEDPVVLPVDRTFRDAWRLAGQAVAIDMPSAKTIAARRFIAWKGEQMKDLAAKIEVNVLLGMVSADLEAQYEAFRTMNLRNVGDRFIAAQTPEELKAVMPQALK